MLKTGIVLQINKNNIIVLTAKNEYIPLQSNMGVKPTIGEEYTGYIYKGQSLSLKLALSLVLLVLSAAFTYFLYSKNAEQYSILLEMNASVELKVNIYGKVIDYSALNSKGGKILDSTTIKNINYSDAVLILYNSAEKNDYFNSYHNKKDKIISVYITNHKNITVDLSKFKNKVMSDNIQININDNGTER